MDTIPPFVFLILALALLCLAGGLIYWLVGYLRGGGTGESEEREGPPMAEAPSEAVPTAQVSAQPVSTAQVPAEPAPAADVPAEPMPTISPSPRELLSICRTENGELAVFVQGQRYHHLRGIKDRQVGTETIEAIRCVMAFAEGWLPAPRQEPIQPAPIKSTVEPVKPTVDEETFLERLRQTDLFPAEKKPPGLLDGLRIGRVRREFDPLMTPADAINHLVQQRLEEHPGMARQDISIITGEDGGLCFRVGIRTFTEIASIPDSEVRALIQDAIREWKES
jgi:hypothetical protein